MAGDFIEPPSTFIKSLTSRTLNIDTRNGLCRYCNSYSKNYNYDKNNGNKVFEKTSNADIKNV